VTQTSLFDLATHRLGTLPARGTAETSREAAIRLDRVLNERCLEVLKALVVIRDGTADEIAAAVHRKPLQVRPRVTNCKAQGFLAWTGEKRLTADGRNAFVWRLSTKGAQYLRGIA
jgi:predicted ArsR family transcriptional regulator